MCYRIADFSDSLDILFQNSYAVFCFIKRAAEPCLASRQALPRALPGALTGRGVTAAVCAKAVALGQTTSAAEAPQRPALQEVSKFMLLEREVELKGHVDRSQLAAAEPGVDYRAVGLDSVWQDCAFRESAANPLRLEWCTPRAGGRFSGRMPQP